MNETNAKLNILQLVVIGGVFGLVFLIGLIFFSPEIKPETKTIQTTELTEQDKANAIATKNINRSGIFQHKGHQYIWFYNDWNANLGGVVHDPDCPCFKHSNLSEKTK